MAEWDSEGRQIPDQTPVAVPLRFKNNSPGELARVRGLIRQVLEQDAQLSGKETYAEANDFDIEDDESLPLTQHELTDMANDVNFEDRVRSVNERLQKGGRRGTEGDRRDYGESGGSAGKRVQDGDDSVQSRSRKDRKSGGKRGDPGDDSGDHGSSGRVERRNSRSDVDEDE